MPLSGNSLQMCTYVCCRNSSTYCVVGILSELEKMSIVQRKQNNNDTIQH